MLRYVLRRVFLMIPTLFVVSVVTFIIIQLPPGDWLTSYIANLTLTGETVDEAEIEALKHRYGLEQPIYVQYFKWIRNFVTGDMGREIGSHLRYIVLGPDNSLDYCVPDRCLLCCAPVLHW